MFRVDIFLKSDGNLLLSETEYTQHKLFLLLLFTHIIMIEAP